ncbi:Carbon catabolite repressor protein [Vigna angularis]|uniref:Carbon catabolite repressor protein n=1 Tax=Phaseolus angularis TaxID=3914 RepID=A0A8T0K1K9_PHAAN|nr:Carbon catabolite repressor protein [Vigna angularis]
MRRTPPSLHFLSATDTATATAANTAAATAASMSSLPSHRGRGRGFSSRPYSGGRGHFVSGDAHLRSVRDVNLGLRRGESGSFANQTVHNQNPPYNPRPHPPPLHHERPQFHNRPYSPPFPPHFPQYRLHPPPEHRPTFRPQTHLRQRPPDYRDWEPSLTPPPPHCERFKVLSYNILADYLALDHRNKLYFHIPPYILDWQWRKRSILFELGLWSADILCLQEVDRFHELAEELQPKGYSGIWKMRTGNPVDGCAIFWKKSRFNLLYEEFIEFNKLGLRDNVAQLCVLEEQEHRPVVVRNGQAQPQYWQAVESTGHPTEASSHSALIWWGEIKLGQVRVLLDKAKAVSKLWNDAPIVICGDFNCTPKSPLYDFISEQKLDLSGIDRNKVSGQASAIPASKPYYGPNSGEISATGSVQAISTEGVKEVTEQNNYRLDTTDLDTLDNQYTHSDLDMSVKSCAHVECGKENDSYPGKDTQETAVDHLKIFREVGSIEEQDASYSNGGLHNVPVNGDGHDITPVTSSAPEAVNSEKSGLGSNEHIPDAVPTSNEELSKKSNLHVPEENKLVEFDCSPTSLQECHQSFTRVRIDIESKDLDNAVISPTKRSSQTSASNTLEVPSTESDKTIGENIGDDSSFVSSLHNAEGVALDISSSMKSDLDKSYQYTKLNSASNLLPVEANEGEDKLSPRQISKSIWQGEATYNPALWTPKEIETATGNEECTFLEHSLQLRSTYTEAMDCSGTRDPYGEPLVTSYHRRFSGTVDYIWRSEGLQTTRVLAPMAKHAMEWTPGFPTKKWGSDHIALVTELAFMKDGTDISTEV